MEIFDMREFDGHELVVFGHDAATGLRAIIAIHSTALGPAAGGCRMWPYQTTTDAVADVLRLSQGMQISILGYQNRANFEADRIAGEETIAAYPAIRASARANRAFLARAVRFLAGEAGLRQFLDIGTGIPAADNTHQVAQAVAPDARIVYVDIDPLVSTHAAALMAAGFAERPGLLRSALKHLFSARKTDWDKFDGLFDAATARHNGPC